MADTQIDIQDRLRALREDYAAQLPGKLDEIERHWSSLVAGDWNTDTAERMHRLTHTLAGGGGTFGFGRMSRQARAIEQILKKCLQEDRVPDREQCARLKSLLDGLRGTVIESPQSASRISDSSGESAQLPHQSPGSVPAGQSEAPLLYLLESDSALAEQLARQVEHFGYRIRTFSDCERLRKAVATQAPAVLIADIGCSEGAKEGADIVCDVQKQHAQTLPVIFISAREDVHARLGAVRAGGEAFLTKPVDVDSLVDRLDKLTNRAEPEPYRILIIDDDTALAEHYALVLGEAGMDVVTVSRPLAVMEALTDRIPELILMDVYMPECSGLELAKFIRQQDNYLSIPIVFLSSEDDMEKQFSALRLGGDDFLTKPITDERLRSSVAIRAERARLINSLMARDSLTGLLKHTRIKEQLEIEESRSRREKATFSFAMIDIDHFKSVNDTYGHMVGDRVIKSLSRLLQQRLRRCDSIGRYGGEEFAVVLPNCDVAAATALVNEIRTRFAEIVHVHDGHDFHVTFSAGIAGFPRYASVTELNRAADEALYSAKRQGRNCVIAAGQEEQ